MGKGSIAVVNQFVGVLKYNIDNLIIDVSLVLDVGYYFAYTTLFRSISICVCERVGSVAVIGIRSCIGIKNQNSAIYSGMGKGSIAVVNQFVGVLKYNIDNLIIDVSLVLDVGYYFAYTTLFRSISICVCERVGSVAVIGIRSCIGIKNQNSAIYSGMGKGSIAVVNQFVGVLKYNIDNLIIDVSLVLDVGYYIANHVNGHRISICVCERVGSVAVIGIRSCIGIKNQNSAIYSGMGKGSIAVVNQFVGVLKYNIDNLIIDVSLVLDVGYYIANHVNGHRISICVCERVGSVAVIGIRSCIGIKNQNSAIYSGMGKGSIAVVNQFVGVLKYNIDNLIIDVSLVLDVGYYIANHVNGHRISICVCERVGSVAVIGIRSCIGIKNQNSAIYSGMGKGSIAVVNKLVGILKYNIDNLIIDVSLVLDVGYYIANHVNGHRISTCVRERVGSVAVIDIRSCIGIKNQNSAIYSGMGKGSIAVVNKLVGILKYNIDNLIIRECVVQDIG